MKRFGKSLALILTLILTLSMLAGCTKSFSIENPVKVNIQFGTEIVEITDADTVSALTEQITSMEFQRGESSTDMAGWEYWLKWYDEDDKVIFEAYVAPNSINYNGRFWYCESGTIDTSYYDSLLEAAK